MRALVVLLSLVANIAYAATATLGWNAVTGATGYVVSYGTASGAYSASVDAGTATSITVANLTQGATYYFAVQTLTATQTSGYSNEVSATMPVQCLRGNSGKPCK